MSELRVTVDGVATVVAADLRPTQIFGDRKEVVVCRINGELRDLWTDLADGDVLESVTIDSEDGLKVLRHSTAHVMAQAVQQIYPEAKLGIGPPITDGFYYDFEEKGTAIYYKNTNVKIADGYIDLHKVVMTFFSKSNPNGIFAVLFYVLSMLVLGFHLWHGFASSFQTLGVNHAKWTPIIKNLGKGFAVIVPLLFALIPILIYLNN